LSDSEDEDINLEDIGSSELEGNSDSDDVDRNPHGFVYSHYLDTYRKSKREKIEQQMKDREDNRDEHKKKFQKKHDKKKGGETNKKKLKHKPFSMLKQKKLKK
jgi:hypothetical protein